MTQTSKTQDLGLFAIRAILAFVFIYHGGQKLFGLFGGHGLEATAGYFKSIGIPMPTVSAILAGASEFVGGLALATGVYMRSLILPLSFTMFVAAFSAHEGFNVQQKGMEYPLTLAIVTVGLALLGPGKIVLPVIKQRTND